MRRETKQIRPSTHYSLLHICQQICHAPDMTSHFCQVSEVRIISIISIIHADMTRVGFKANGVKNRSNIFSKGASLWLPFSHRTFQKQHLPLKRNLEKTEWGSKATIYTPSIIDMKFSNFPEIESDAFFFAAIAKTCKWEPELQLKHSRQHQIAFSVVIKRAKRLVLRKSEDQTSKRTNSYDFMHEMRTKRFVHTHNNNNNNNNNMWCAEVVLPWIRACQ